MRCLVLLAAGLIAGWAAPAGAACSDPPRPQVDWLHCAKDGENFAGGDLKGAVLRDASFFRTDLSGAALVRADGYRAKFVRATLAGLRDMLRDPKAAMVSLKKRDPLLNDAVELERLQLILDRAMLTPFVKANGFGSVVPERMARAITVNAEAFGVANPPKPETIYTTKFLPPQSERMP